MPRRHARICFAATYWRMFLANANIYQPQNGQCMNHSLPGVPRKHSLSSTENAWINQLSFSDIHHGDGKRFGEGQTKLIRHSYLDRVAIFCFEVQDGGGLQFVSDDLELRMIRRAGDRNERVLEGAILIWIGCTESTNNRPHRTVLSDRVFANRDPCGTLTLT